MFSTKQHDWNQKRDFFRSEQQHADKSGALSRQLVWSKSTAHKVGPDLPFPIDFELERKRRAFTIHLLLIFLLGFFLSSKIRSKLTWWHARQLACSLAQLVAFWLACLFAFCPEDFSPPASTRGLTKAETQQCSSSRNAVFPSLRRPCLRPMKTNRCVCSALSASDRRCTKGT